MDKQLLGTSDVRISQLLLGTWQTGKTMWAGIEDDGSIATIRAALDVGMTTIDTAEVYGKGHSEVVIGRALAGVQRDRYELASKVFADRLGRDDVIAACEQSLQRLQTDYLDLYQIHWPAGSFGTERVPIADTMDALTRLKTDGKIRAIGVSNFNRAQLVEAARHGRIDSLQPPYSLFWRHAEAELIPYCIANDISVLAYSSMAQGLLAGKFSRNHQFAEGDHRAEGKLFQGETFQCALDAVDRLRPIAARHHCSLAQLALAWVVAQPNTAAIAGARSPLQVTDNAGASRICLSAIDLKELDAISRPLQDRLDLNNPVLWDFVY
ncbi:putative oxidoreductase [Rubidibacter lacunae KORDI 51-2]|uniref:Putative oxidoreductase n=1 Tax=Rubidibacter lacunae KORDI 51-2 TaxID=582515 RepID=U5DFL7_9CHRO|nr:aldo/keto reductase [Rubidibacter lacunae]ERN40391.1 putative oxidoreductase [Rubidibacter lacunae KORDI 51-2]